MKKASSSLNSQTTFAATGAGPAKQITGGLVTDVNKCLYYSLIDLAAIDADDFDQGGADVS